MSKKYTFLYLILLPFWGMAQLFPNLGGQRAGISAYTFLKMDISPRSSGMGGASLCQSGDAYSIFVNPASLSEVEGTSLGLSHTFWTAGINQTWFSASKPTKIGHFGVSMNYLTSGAMPVRTEFEPDGTGQYFYSYYSSVGATYSKQLTDFFRYGVSLHWVHEQLAQTSANTATIDLGFLYRTDFKDLSFGVNVQNFGFNSRLKGVWEIDSAFYNNPISLDNYPPPTVFQLGVSMIPYKTESQSIAVSLQLNHPNDNSENIRIGAEYAYKSLLFARLGYKINVKDQPFPTAGFGIRTRIGKHPLKMDYAFEPMQYLGAIHKVALSFQFNQEKRSEEPTK
ncbi:MAG: PorV/PorQ family protein [Bacteroidia bacterium]|nr:PorV/PorQ family protein [Bacteroidia bacterium]